jgi:hypothetical protein
MKIGVAILSVMAGIWAAWSSYARHSGQWAYVGVAVIALVPMALMMNRRFGPRTKSQARRIGRLVGLASFAEVAVIVIGVQMLAHAGRPDLIVCLVAAAVGLHFLPLARWMPMPRYYACGLALVIAASVGIVIPGDLRVLLVAGTASAILWLTALSIVVAVPPSEPSGDVTAGSAQSESTSAARLLRRR